jgi:hypothetical protein
MAKTLVVNVFTLKYHNMAIYNGLGDFIRGTWSVQQACNTLGIDADVRLDMRYHPCGAWVEDNVDCKIDDPAQIVYCQHREDIISHINKLHSNGISIILLGTANVCDDGPLSEQFIDNICKALRPRRKLAEAFLTVYPKNLKPHDYIVVHLRCGDPVGSTTTAIQLEDAVAKIKLGGGADGNTVFLSDSTDMVEKLTARLGSTTLPTKPAHSFRSPTEESMRDVWIDFFVIANARKVLCLSVYPHGSSFSEWASKVHGVPYKLVDLLARHGNEHESYSM